MKLFITNHCVVKGGDIKEAGEIHDTQVADRKQDLEAFDLIRSGKAVELSDKEAVEEAKAQIAIAEQAAADAGKPPATKAAKAKAPKAAKKE